MSFSHEVRVHDHESNSLPRMACRFLFVVAGQLRADNWPQWRGPDHNGFSKETKLPVEWSESKNIAWKLTLPGMGGSTPIVWGDNIFLTCQDGDDIVLLCVGVDGKVAWKRKLASGTATYRKDEGNPASAPASTDGKHVFVFVGTGDVACFDFDGKEIWKLNAQERYGKFRIMHGMHTTPLLHDDRLYMPLLHQGGQWVVALDKTTGKEVWKVARPTDGEFEGEHSYASPCLYQNGADSYLVVHGCDYTTAHRLSDGSEIWRLGDLNLRMRKDQTFRLVASPAVAADVIVVPTAKNGPVVAIKPSAKGLVKTGSEYEVWRKAKGTTDVPTPLIHDGIVYMCKENGTLVCMDAKTGGSITPSGCSPAGIAARRSSRTASCISPPATAAWSRLWRRARRSRSWRRTGCRTSSPPRRRSPMAGSTCAATRRFGLSSRPVTR